MEVFCSNNGSFTILISILLIISGAILLAIAIFSFVKIKDYEIEKNKDNNWLRQATGVIGLITVTIGLVSIFIPSVFFGEISRNVLSSCPPTPTPEITFVPTSILTPTPIQLTIEPTPQPTTPIIITLQPTSAINCVKQEFDRIPNSNMYDIILNPNQFVIWSSGRICVNYNGVQLFCDLSGNSARGFISVFYPVDNQTTTYQLTNLIPNNNWYAIYTDCNQQIAESETATQTNLMTLEPNCITGCSYVGVNIFRGNSIENRQ